MELTESHLDEIRMQVDKIRDLAAALTPVADIAALLDLSEDALRMELDMPGSPVRVAFRKAVAETSLAIRRQEIQFARMGSPIAVQSASSYLATLYNDF